MGWAAGPPPTVPRRCHRAGAQESFEEGTRANAHPARSRSRPEAGSLQRRKTWQRTERGGESGVSAPPRPPAAQTSSESSAPPGGAPVPPAGWAGWQQGQWAAESRGDGLWAGLGRSRMQGHGGGSVPPAPLHALLRGASHHPLPGAGVHAGSRACPPALPPPDTERLHLFLRQSCILILDVFPEAYFS